MFSLVSFVCVSRCLGCSSLSVCLSRCASVWLCDCVSASVSLSPRLSVSVSFLHRFLSFCLHHQMPGTMALFVEPRRGDCVGRYRMLLSAFSETIRNSVEEAVVWTLKERLREAT